MYTASEKQLLVATMHLTKNNGSALQNEIEQFGREYFCSFKLDWNDAFKKLLQNGDLINDKTQISLKPGLDIKNITKNKPRYKYWYNDWYKLAEKSKMHSELCSHSYNIDLCQTGMMTKYQIDYLSNLIVPFTRGLDVGCGVGKVTEYLWSKTNTEITGIDTIYTAIRLAQRRSYSKKGLDFKLDDMRSFIKQKETFYDFILSMDTIYFIGTDYKDFLQDCMDRINNEGRIFIFYSAWEGKDQMISFNENKLGKYLIENKFEFEVTDFTDDDFIHWRKKKTFLEQNEKSFINEGNKLLFDKRYSEAKIFDELGNSKKMKRFLYTIFVK